MAREKENLSWNSIEGLTRAEIKVLEALEGWNHFRQPANAYFIALKADLSEGHVQRCLRHLRYRGIVLGQGRKHRLNVKVIKNAKELSKE